MNNSNYETELIFKDDTVMEMYNRTVITAATAVTMASSLEKQKIDLDSRYPEKNEQGEKNDGKNGRPSVGMYREESSHYRNAIIPLTVTMTIDGISGILPLNTFPFRILNFHFVQFINFLLLIQKFLILFILSYFVFYGYVFSFSAKYLCKT